MLGGVSSEAREALTSEDGGYEEIADGPTHMTYTEYTDERKAVLQRIEALRERAEANAKELEDILAELSVENRLAQEATKRTQEMMQRYRIDKP